MKKNRCNIINFNQTKSHAFEINREDDMIPMFMVERISIRSWLGMSFKDWHDLMTYHNPQIIIQLGEKESGYFENLYISLCRLNPIDNKPIFDVGVYYPTEDQLSFEEQGDSAIWDSIKIFTEFEKEESLKWDIEFSLIYSITDNIILKT